MLGLTKNQTDFIHADADLRWYSEAREYQHWATKNAVAFFALAKKLRDPREQEFRENMQLEFHRLDNIQRSLNKAALRMAKAQSALEESGETDFEAKDQEPHQEKVLEQPAHRSLQGLFKT